MKKTIVAFLTLSVMPLAGLSFAEARPQSQADSMKHADMKKDGKSQDGMSKDQMSHEMAEAKTLKGWVTDSECAAYGEKKCGNKEHVAQGASLVLVTDGDNKIWTIANPETVAEHQGHHVQLKAITDAGKNTVSVQEVKMLK